MVLIHEQEVGSLGFGLMGLTWRAKQTEDDVAFPLLVCMKYDWRGLITHMIRKRLSLLVALSGILANFTGHQNEP